MRRASYEEVLCLWPKPNFSSRISPRTFTTYKILSNRIFSDSLPIVSKRVILGRMRVYVKYSDHPGVLPHCRKVMDQEDRIEDRDQEGYCSQWEMLRGPVRDTVRARVLADLETPDDFLNVLRVA